MTAARRWAMSQRSRRSRPPRSWSGPSWRSPGAAGRSRLRRPRRRSPRDAGGRLRQPAVERLERLLAALEPPREVADEVAERTAVAAQRGDRHPLVGAVVAAADRAELDGGHAGLEERDDVGGAVPPDAQRFALDRAADGV